MFIIIGAIVVLASLVIGFTIEGGNLLLLLQFSEFIIIIGAAIGGLLISAPLSLIMKIVKTIPKAISAKQNSKED